MASNPEPIPTDDVVTTNRKLTTRWYDWLLNLATLVVLTARRLPSSTVNLVAQNASLVSTVLVAGQAQGRFRVTILLVTEQAATTNSGIGVTITFARNNQICTLTTPALINGAVGVCSSDSFLVDNDAAVAITYQTTYVSVGATPMLYGLEIIVETLS